MDIHKPKPWHGFREFLKEYAIIVVGVLTALAAEQGVEWLHWRHEAETAREALRYDLRRVVGWSGAVAAEAPCKAAHLAEMRHALDQAQSAHRLPPFAWRGGPASYAWSLRSWSALTSGQVLPHIPNREQLILSAIAGPSGLPVILAMQQGEFAAWGDLSDMTGPGRATSDVEIAALRSALVRAEAAGMAEKNLGATMATYATRSGLIAKAESDKAWAEGLATGAATTLCRHASPPPSGDRSPLESGLLRPAERPGEGRPDTTGVAGAISTDR